MLLYLHILYAQNGANGKEVLCVYRLSEHMIVDKMIQIHAHARTHVYCVLYSHHSENNRFVMHEAKRGNKLLRLLMYSLWLTLTANFHQSHASIISYIVRVELLHHQHFIDATLELREKKQQQPNKQI